MAFGVLICIISLIGIAGAVLSGILKSRGTNSRISILPEQESKHPVERQPEQDTYQRRFHEKALAETTRGQRFLGEETSCPEPKSDSAEIKQRNLSALLPHQFVVIDLETTGLSPTAHEIIEIGALKITLEMSQHPAFQTFVRPAKPVPTNITKMTGITQAMLDEHGIELKSALQLLMEFIGDLPLVTYNAQFDMGFLWTAAMRCGVVLPNHYSCALKRARRAFPDFPSHKLSYMAERFNLPEENQHRAVGDCKRTAHVFLLSTVALNQKVRWSTPVMRA